MRSKRMKHQMRMYIRNIAAAILAVAVLSSYAIS